MRRSPCIAAAPGAAIVVVDTALALALGNSSVFVPLLVIGPLVAAALAAAALHARRGRAGGGVRDPARARRQQLPLGRAHRRGARPSPPAASLAVLAAKGRRSYEEALANERAARRRVDFVARAGQLLEAPPEPEAMLREIVRMAVPYMAELCIVDLVARRRARRDHGLRDRPAHARDAARVAHALPARRRRARTPSRSSPRTGRAHLQHEIGPERLRAFAVDDEHLRLMPGAGYATSLAVPLIARGRTIGVLSFMRFGGAPPYADERRRAGGRGRAPRGPGPRQRAPVRRAAPHRGPARGGARPTSRPR